MPEPAINFQTSVGVEHIIKTKYVRSVGINVCGATQTTKLFIHKWSA